MCLLVFPLLAPGSLRAGTLDDAAHELAMKICTGQHKQEVSVRWRENPDASRYWPESSRKTFVEQLSACGMRAQEGPDAAALELSVHVGPSRVVFVADLTDSAGGQQVRIVEAPRASLGGSRNVLAGVRLNSELLWQQPEPIESAMEWQAPDSQSRSLFLFGGGVLSRIQFAEGVWKPLDSYALPKVYKRSRGSGAQFVPGDAESGLEVLLGNGTVCRFSPDGPISFACGSAKAVEPLPRLISKCEDQPRYLTTGSGDYSQPDRISLNDSASGPAAGAFNEGDSDAIEVPGPVLSMSVTADSKAAFPVVRNIFTGSYEVYRITAVCSD